MSTNNTSSNPAMQHLRKLKDDIMAKKITEPTLAFWRLKNPLVMKALEGFCGSDDWTSTTDKTAALKEVKDLFLELNDIMDDQERLVWPDESAGKADVAKTFYQRAMSYQHLFDNKRGVKIINDLVGLFDMLSPIPCRPFLNIALCPHRKKVHGRSKHTSTLLFGDV